MVALATRRRTVKPAKDRVIAIDTETTGLFIHKGCRGFTFSACDDVGQIFLWKFPVDPWTRHVTYNQSKLDDFIDTVSKYGTVVFHNANYDLQVLAGAGIPWSWFFENFKVHDTMVMSHAYKSDNRHGLKELGVLLADYPDDDEKELETAVKSARKIAKKLEWAYADKNNLHHTLVGTQKEHFRCDYWLPEAIASYENYPHYHKWWDVCDIYAGKDAERTMVIFEILKELLHNVPHQTQFEYPAPTHKDISLYFGNDSAFDYTQTGTLYDKYEESRRLIWPILDMQNEKIPVKIRALVEAKNEFTQRQHASLSELRRIVKDNSFNPRSPEQLSHALFQKLGHEPVKQGKKGPSTDKDVISKLLAKAPLEKDKKPPDKYRFLVSLREYRKETTTLTYINNYDKHSRPTAENPFDRRIQPFFSQTRTGTGRLSCTDPNTTNVGKKDMSNPFADDKDKVRAALFAEILGIDLDHRFSLRNVFGPKPRTRWTCIDYDQFQLRIFASVSESYELLEGFERGDDIHQLVAKIIFNKDEISDVERTAAKAINFGLLFGAGPAKIELLAGVPGLYNRFMSNFPKAKMYLDAQSRLARQYGYVHTVGGYRLYVPHDAPHAASCYVIQGTEAEIVKRAMVGVHAYQRIENNDISPYRLLMMVHDELVFTSRIPEEHERIRYFRHLSRIMDIMESSGNELGIPTKVDAKVTDGNWADRDKLEFDRLAA